VGGVFRPDRIASCRVLLFAEEQRGAVRIEVDWGGYRDGSGARTVDSHVRALRRKLGDGVVRTVHGVGYALGESTDDAIEAVEPVDAADGAEAADAP